MKKFLVLSAFVIGCAAYSQQATQQPSLAANLKLAVNDFNAQVKKVNDDLRDIAKNHGRQLNREFATNVDFNADAFADFGRLYNYMYSDTYNDPVIRHMPPPGPNLDYYNVSTCSGGLYDTVKK